MNAVYTSLSMKRRYEVWFLRCGLADGSGAWWFRYLVMNPGRVMSGNEPTLRPAQVWATWFPVSAVPQTFIEGFPLDALDLSARKSLPFHCRIGESGIDAKSCWGKLNVDGRKISWRLQIDSRFGVVLSDKGWIGFSRSPHSDAQFSGEIVLDQREFTGGPLGYGVQGHNCGFRHRNYWRWLHAYFPQTSGGASTLEAVIYEMPFGLVFRKAVLWHRGKSTTFKNIEEQEIARDSNQLTWRFLAQEGSSIRIEVVAAAHPPGIHTLPYAKTDGSGIFPVANASRAQASLRLASGELLETRDGAVLEMGGV
jgi:hypothetical protein